MKIAVLCLSLALAAAKINDKEWDAFKLKFKKSYKSEDEEDARYGIFKATKEKVKQLNALNGNMGKAFGITWSADRYEQEKHKKGLVKPRDWKPTAPVRESLASKARKPASINWRYTEAVTPIKNQGQCGSCWAFSATEAVESQMILGTGGKVAISLSPQQVASCTPNTGEYGCLGCNGGFTEGAYEYLKAETNKGAGLANAFYIPYMQSLTESDATMACPTSKVEAIAGETEQLSGGYAAVSGYEYAIAPCTSGACDKQDLAGLAAALEKEPLSICVNAGAWNEYTGGVMSAKACGPAGASYQDHCVMATGFNTTAPTPYWIVRNSWASTWGEEGYIYLEMAENTCGLADDVTIPKVKLDLTEEEEVEAAVRRENMYQRATRAV